MARSLTALAGAMGLGLLVGLAAPGVAMAQSDCACVLSGGGSPVGNISEANGDVFLAGADGPFVPVGAGAPLTASDILTTGPSASATANFGGGCSLALGGSSQLSISVAADGKLCVRVEEPSLQGEGNVMPWVLFGGAVIPPAVVALGSGFSNPVSK